MQRPADVLIVGAGPVGLTMAATLAYQGVSCRLIDKSLQASDKSKALVLWSRTLELFDSMGLAETFVQAGMKIHGASIYGNGERLVHLGLDGVKSPFGFPLMIPQTETERVLAAHLHQQGIPVERGVELTKFQETPAGIVSTLRHTDGSEETVATSWLIGCDGAHSTVRHLLGVPFTGHAEPNDWLLADIHVEGPLAGDEVSVFWHARGVLVFFPITRDRFRVIADLGAADKMERRADPTLAEVQAKVDERGPGGLTLVDPVWLANFRINERKVSDYRHGRVMLAGDAAHIHSPAGGQGMNTGMQDAFNLAWKLALISKGCGRIDPLLDSYSQERSAVGDQVLHGAEMATMMATLRNPVAQSLRNHVAGLMTSFGFVKNRIGNALCELSINYRHSPLSAGNWPLLKGGLVAGDRLPDAALTSLATGQSTTLFALQRTNRHLLLLLPTASGAADVATLLRDVEQIIGQYPADLFAVHVLMKPGHGHPDDHAEVEHAETVPASSWLDPQGALHKQLGVEHDTLLLVRPDGYLGYRSQPVDFTAVAAYLGQYLQRRNRLSPQV